MNKFVDIFEYWIVINNISRPISFIAEGQRFLEIKVHDTIIWEQIKTAPHIRVKLTYPNYVN